MPLQPFTGQLDDDTSTGLKPFDGKLDDDSEGKFKSGESFKATKDLLPDLPSMWETFKSQWENRHNTPMTAKDMEKMMKSEHAAGSSVLDLVGGIPAMAAGALSGIYTGVGERDATKGLEAANKTVQKYLPSTLMGNEEDQQNGGYHAAMAPVTAVMDTLNAVPEGYGEILNAAGAPNAAAQVSDAGKLAILAGAGLGGAKGMVDMVRGGKADALSHADKLEPNGLKPFEGKLDEVIDTPVEPVMGQTAEMFPTNPYDVAGHVTKLEEGRPSTIDTPQGDLFGGKSLEDTKVEPVAPDALVNAKTVTEPMAKVEPINPAMQEAFKAAEIEKAHADVAEIATAQKEAHYSALEDLAIAQRAGEIDYQRVKDMGDKTLMDQASNDRMSGAIRDGNLTDAIKAIAENHPDRPYRDLALYLKDKVEGIKTQLHPEDMIRAGDRNVSGYFDPNTGVVGYSGIGATSPHTVMHETVHALTSQFMQARPNDVRVVAVKDLYNKLSTKMVKEFPGIVNAREFVAEAFSNPKFQDFLKGQRIDNRSAFQRFVDGVKTMLGMKTGAETTITNALTHVIDLSKQVIEASDKATRNTIMESFKSAGMSNKLADLMAQAPKDTKPMEVVQNGNVKGVVSKIPGLEDPISDFKFYDKPVSEIIEMAQRSPDIPSNMVEKFGQQMQAGALFESLKTRNPVVKYTYERITRAFQEATHQIKVNLTDPVTGLKRYMRDLTPSQKGEIHGLMMLNEGKKEFTSTELAERG